MVDTGKSKVVGKTLHNLEQTQELVWPARHESESHEGRTEARQVPSCRWQCWHDEFCYNAVKFSGPTTFPCSPTNDYPPLQSTATYLNRRASRSLSNKTSISFSFTGPWTITIFSWTGYLNISDDGTRLVFDEFDTDLSDAASWSCSTEDFGYFSEFDRLRVHFVVDGESGRDEWVVVKIRYDLTERKTKVTITLPYWNHTYRKWTEVLW